MASLYGQVVSDRNLMPGPRSARSCAASSRDSTACLMRSSRDRCVFRAATPRQEGVQVRQLATRRSHRPRAGLPSAPVPESTTHCGPQHARTARRRRVRPPGRHAAPRRNWGSANRIRALDAESTLLSLQCRTLFPVELQVELPVLTGQLGAGLPGAEVSLTPLEAPRDVAIQLLIRHLLRVLHLSPPRGRGSRPGRCGSRPAGRQGSGGACFFGFRARRGRPGASCASA
jgi:hypothetical protein